MRNPQPKTVSFVNWLWPSDAPWLHSIVGLLMAWFPWLGISSLLTLHVDNGDGRALWYSTGLVRTTTQLYGLPYAMAKVKSYLFHKKHGLIYNIDDNYKWAHKLWFDRFLINHMQAKVHWLCIWESKLRTTRCCWGGNNNWLGIRHAFETYPKKSCYLCHCKHLITHVDIVISIKRFSIHMFVPHPYPYPAHSKEQWCHCFVDSLSPKTQKHIWVNPFPSKSRTTNKNT